MRRHLLCLLCSAAIVVVVARAAPAADAKAADAKPAASGDAAALFDRLDANHDGQLTGDEIPAEKKGLFERLLRLAGKPADGKLSRDEFIAQLNVASDDHPPPAGGAGKSGGPTPPAGKTPVEKPAAGPIGPLQALDPEKIFDRLDTKHTGKITAADIPEGRPLLKRLVAEAVKTDGGSISKEEFVKLFKELLAKRASGDAPPVKPAADGKPAANPAGNGLGNGDRLIKRLLALSKRNDGKLTKDDLPERLRDRFDKIDTNRDGVIDEAELRDWIAKVQARLSAAPGK
jgi:Ca2+-binding EF-hand superfamily protein